MRQGFIAQAFDKFLGRGTAAVTVPALDGALKPNNHLEDLPEGIAAGVPDCIVAFMGKALWSDGSKLVAEDGIKADLGSEITALAAQGERLAVATLADGLGLLDASFQSIAPDWSEPVRHVTALDFGPNGGIWFAIGSTQNAPTEWRRDLLEMNRSGLIGRADPTSGEVRMVKHRLRYPSGIAVLLNGAIVFSEAWSSHVIEMAADGAVKQVVLDEIPGYPGRIEARAGGGYWLCIFAPRSPLIEFVLREPGYRKAMLGEVPPDYWVAPNYSSGKSFNEPMQGGALKQMGILKPWAPTLSYGLVIELDKDFIPVRSFHSRAGGRRHGITSAVELGGELWLAGRGAGEILRLALETEGESA
ncbi:strictosidine synthase [uncultured Cohaesibacter sp.]|uniref:strictosidine synthase n=1 Tax=uncultured Cohaesibacter sp. TaxID=1002546 RepID=UPI0029C7223F|nr:strictosidine synthase [uncultured Cohaesibacter sp.]